MASTSTNKFVRFWQGVWTWLKANPGALLVALGTAIGAFVIYKSKDNTVTDIHDAIGVGAVLGKMKADAKRAEEIKAGAAAKEAELSQLEEKIKDSKRRVVEISEGKPLKELTDDEIAKKFTDSGI